MQIYFVTVVCCWLTLQSCSADRIPKLLLISFDGFRWDYLSKTDTPNFDRITDSGVKAKWIKDSFTSLTFPNHYTIVTGLYEESHGIVANMFYDPVLNEVFTNSNRTTVEDGKFWGGEPIWVTNQLQQGRTGVYWWVGSEAEIKGVRPTYYMNYTQHNASMELWRNNTDTVMQWLTEPGKVVDMALLYFKEPDHTGHIYGPDSPEVVEMIKKCDNITGYILDQIKERGLSDFLNIIITSDHGMANMNRSRFVTLDDHIDKNETEHLLNYVVGTSVWPKKDFTGELYSKLSTISEHVSAWKKNEIPPEYHYTNNPRIPPILLSADEGWGIKENWDNPHFLLGRHGFNNSKMEMHPFFVATGPVFKKGYVSEPFENVHIYELMCHILGITAAPNNGSLDAVRDLLSEDVTSSAPDYQDEFSIAKWMVLAAGVVVGCVMLFLVGKELHKSHKRKTRNEYFTLDKDFQEYEDHESLLSNRKA